MARDTLTGSRIRERRTATGMKQAELAARAGISASYLNLIEHNRRRIGGKLLLSLARILEVEPSALIEGAEAALISTLREAAAAQPDLRAELDRIDEFAGRFPGWAALLAANRRRVDALERTVETLTDRLTHDPHLAASLHDMLSTVTSIRSTARHSGRQRRNRTRVAGPLSPQYQRRCPAAGGYLDRIGALSGFGGCPGQSDVPPGRGRSLSRRACLSV
ncbi:helix-turn-helix transcriptional regulator [Phaeobacter sp. J2-8]|uniref:helix-turn-helix domain-containing protein n=1 Tax=Phaeobacter sp. J2-8 TaxID=2931394 RepID=UPI0032AF5F2E